MEGCFKKKFKNVEILIFPFMIIINNMIIKYYIILFRKKLYYFESTFLLVMEASGAKSQSNVMDACGY